jgi:hypothetical protein
MMTKIYDLAYEINGDTINLEQDMGCGEVSRIDLHPVHLRVLAEAAGTLPNSNAEAELTIARLSRQLRVLAKRIDRLDTMFLAVAEKGHECVDEECAFSAASWELAEEFIADLQAPAASPTHNAANALSFRASASHGDNSNAERQKRYRERQKQRNRASVTPVTAAQGAAGAPKPEIAGAVQELFGGDLKPRTTA